MTEFTITTALGQLTSKREYDLTAEETLDLMWIVLTTLDHLDINEVKLHLLLLRDRNDSFPVKLEESIDV